MEISKEQIKHLAHLSRLELSDSEIDAMQGDMSKILGFVAQVEELDLDGVEPLTQMSRSVLIPMSSMMVRSNHGDCSIAMQWRRTGAARPTHQYTTCA